MMKERQFCKKVTNLFNEYLPRWSPGVNLSRMSPKTIANLTMYSRKVGDYNGTLIFEIDDMKNSSPLNPKFTFFAMLKPK